MVTPHPVRAPYLIQLFSHLDSFLKSFFWCQSFGSKCSHIMHLPVALMLTGCSTLAFCRFFLCTQSKRNHFPDLQVIPRQYYIHNTYFLHWHFPFVFPFVFIFWVFHVLDFQLMYQRMIALIPFQAGSQSLDPSSGNFFSHLFPMLV